MKWEYKEEKPGPLVRKTLKYKNPSMEFFCPLCRTKRAFVGKPRLNRLNYLQIIAISSALIFFLYPLMEHRSLFIFFVVWVAFEMGARILFRKEIPCPHCGFDASWYKRDVKVARKRVAEFWEEKEKKSPSETDAENQFPPQTEEATDFHLNR